MNRRDFIKSSAIIATAQIAVPSYAQKFNDHAAIEADAIAQMKDANHPNIILINKGNSQLVVAEDGERRVTTPVIIGKNATPTPTGIFSLRNMFQGPSYPKMFFHYDDRVIYLIHDVIKGREQAMLKDDPQLRILSDGCVNISQPFLNMVMDFARSKGEETGFATPIAILPERYSSEKFAAMVKGFKPVPYTYN